MHSAAVRSHGFAVSAFLVASATLLPALVSQQIPAPASKSQTRVPGPSAAAPQATGDRKLLLREAAARESFTFMPNAGQDDPANLFVARGGGFSVGLQKNALELKSFRAEHPDGPRPAASTGGMTSALPRPESIDVTTARVEFAGANPNVRIEGLDPASASVNFIAGSDPARWRTNLHGFARVRYRNLYPGIDLIYYGERQRHLEYDLVVAPGADPAQVHLRVFSAQPAFLDHDGNLRFDGASGRMSLMHPVLYQDSVAGKHTIAGSFVQLAKNEFGFAPGTYDRTRPLVIDPTIKLLYATYAGGIHNDEAFDLTLDSSGNTYITGWSASQDFPVTGNAYQQTRQNIGSYVYDVVVMKFSSSGTLIFSTFLGGAQNDQGNGIRVDTSGQIFLAGTTNSSDFPVTSNAFQKTWGGGNDAFFSVLSNDGSQLIYSTYLGGSGDEGINRLIQGANDSFYVGGGASAAGLPVTTGAYQTAVTGADTGFIANLVFTLANAQPLAIPALTFIGGSSSQEGGFNDMALDAAGNVYATGITTSQNWPTTANAYQTASSFTLSGGCYNSASPNSIGTVVEFSANLKTLIYSSVLGGKTEDQNGYPVCNQFGRAIHPDGKGNVWVIGTVGMQDFPTTSNAISRTLNNNGSAGVDIFVAELTPGASSTTLTYGSYLGGSQLDYGARAAWDSSGDIWITATSQSTDFPGMVQGTSLQPTNAGGYDTVITELQPDGSKILYATYLGGSGDEDANSGRGTIALDANNNVYLTGGTGSTNYPVTGNAAQYAYANGDSGPDGYDIYYTVLGGATIGTIGPVSAGNVGDSTITIQGAGFVSGAACTLTSGSTTITAATVYVNATGTSITCTFPLAGASTGSYAVTVANPNGGATLSKAGAFTVNNGSGPNINVDIVGRPAIRVNTATPFVLTVSNTGDTNAYGVFIQLAYPSTATLTLNYSPLPNLPNNVPFNNSGYPTFYTANGMNYQYVFMAALTAGASSSYSFNVTDATYGDSPSVTANWGYLSPTALVQGALPGAQAPTQGLDELVLPGVAPRRYATTGGPKPLACFNDVVGAVANAYGATNPVSAAQACITASTISVLVGAVTGSADGSLPNPINNGAAFGGWLAQNTLPNCASLLGPQAGAAASAYQAWQAVGDCGGQNAQKAIIKFLTTGSIDPNYKNGSSGDGSTSAYITQTRPITYSVGFENEATATAPAARVVVTDQLNAARVNGSQLSLGPISFGTNRITPPAGSTTFETLYTPPGVTTYKVRIQGSLDSDTDLLKWTFETIDPSTGLPPTDPSIGFLPPDVDGIVGQGSVGFNVMPMQGLTTGTQITNNATIVFDSNASIATPVYLNTLDVDPPVSKVAALPAATPKTGTTTPFTVSWSGTDVGSGIASYTIYVSDNGAAYTAWQQAVTTTSATYTGQTNHTYAFYSIATDGAGNVEAAKTNAEASTTITASATTSTLTASATTLAPGQTLTLTVTVAPQAGTAVPTGTVTFVSGTSGSTTLGTATLNASGVATLITSTLAAGTYTIQANYGGDSNFSLSSSNTVSVTVALLPTSTTLATSAAVANPGASVTFTATVSPSSGTGTPTGSVTFLAGSATLGMGTLNGGKATLTTSALAVGTYSITAQYTGSTTFAVSTSSALTELIANPTFTLSVSPTTLAFPAGQTGTATFTVTPVAGYNQPVTFACAGLPSHSTCTFAPSSLTPTGSAVSTTLTIATNVATASLEPAPRPGSSAPARILAALLFFGLGGVVRLRRSGVRSTRLCRLCVVVIILSAFLTLSGCGSSISNATPKGTSTVVVTATGGGSVIQTASLSVTIQ
jgi:hypothetical protein